MARDHARIRLDLGSDPDWRDLTHDAQWLYTHLLISPTLNLLGVGDWRPARIAATTPDLTANDVEVFAAELERGWFVLIDRDSEESLIRSFVKHDGLLDSPNMVKAMVKAYPLIASRTLRAVAVGQVVRQRIKSPELKGWSGIGDLLDKPSMDPAEAFSILPPNPSVNPSANHPPRDTGGHPETDAPLLSSVVPPVLQSSTKGQVSLVRDQSGPLDDCERAHA